MNIIITISEDLAERLLSSAKNNGSTLEQHVNNIVSNYITEEVADKVAAEVADTPVSQDTVTETQETEQQENTPRPAPLTNDTTTVFNTDKTKEKGAPLYCKREENSWKIL